MGLFSKTDEEIKNEEIGKKYSLIINAIYESKIDEEIKEYLISYISKVRRGFPNDFDDLDTLIGVMLELIDDRFFDKDEIENHLTKVINVYHQIVDKESIDYDKTKDIFIKFFVGYDGIIRNELYDEGLYALFNDKKDYFELMITIVSNDELLINFSYIKDYIAEVSKYCLNQDVLKRDVISYLEGFVKLHNDDYENYNKENIEIAKRRIGVYSLNPKELAMASSNLKKVETFLDQFQIYMTNIKAEKTAVNELVESSKREIKLEAKQSIEQIRRIIELEKQALTKKLDSYLLDLEEALKLKSDETFKQIIRTYQSQVKEFRDLFKSYSVATSKDFLAIQKASEESIKKLQDYVSSEPQFKQLLTKVEEQNSVRSKIIELVSKEEKLLENGDTEDKKEIVTIPGYDRLMVPYRHLILPQEISNTVIHALDESIPFDIRIEKVLERMEENEKEGVIYHKKVKEILIDLMEGDWPYLWGPSGTGKSFMVKQIAELLGINFTKAGKITEPYSILGYNDPQGRYQITPSFVSVLYGQLLFLDELDNGNPDTQVVLNDIYSELLNKLENKDEPCEITFGTDVVVDVHPNFRMISAGNTSGEGENEAFSSRGKMDESVMERMSPIYIDYDNRVEERILKDYPSWYRLIVEFRNACIKYAETTSNSKDSAQGITTTRDASAIKKYITHNSKSIEQIIDEKFIQTKDSEYLKALAKTIASIYEIDYSRCSNPEFNLPLKDVDDKTLAKKFIVRCKEGIR